jgi:hypothetical protein
MPRATERQRGTRRLAAALALALSTCLVLTSCGASPRSVAAVCHVWDTQGLSLHDRFEAANSAVRTSGTSGLLSALASIVGAPNELSKLMAEMADVAPGNAEADFNSVSTAFKKLSESESESLTNPLAALGGNLIEGFAVSGSLSRVDAFLSTHCGIPRHAATNS